MPSFHALGSCTESSRHPVLKSVEAHRSTSMPLRCRCCHQRSLLRHQRRHVWSAPKCQHTSLAGYHTGRTQQLRHTARNRFLACARQAWSKSVSNPTTTPTPPHTRSCTSYRLDAPPEPGKPSLDTTNSHRPEGLRSEASVATIAGNERPSPKRGSARTLPTLASQGWSNSNRSRAPEANICRRLLLDRPDVLGSLPSQRES